jgi:hypothetical protein
MDDAGPQSFGKALQLLVTTQERNLEIARRWSESVLELLREQTEGNRAVLESLGSSLTTMERVLASQEETNQALRASLDAYREIVDRAAGTQERSIELVQATMATLVQGLQGQLEAATALLAAAPGPSAGWGGDLVQQWMGAYRDLLEAYRPPPRRDQGHG